MEIEQFPDGNLDYILRESQCFKYCSLQGIENNTKFLLGKRYLHNNIEYNYSPRVSRRHRQSLLTLIAIVLVQCLDFNYYYSRRELLNSLLPSFFARSSGIRCETGNMTRHRRRVHHVLPCG